MKTAKKASKTGPAGSGALRSAWGNFLLPLALTGLKPQSIAHGQETKWVGYNPPMRDGNVNFRGINDRKGFNGAIKYPLSFKPEGAPDTDLQPESNVVSFGRRVSPPLPTHVVQMAAADGWEGCGFNPTLGIYLYDSGLLASPNERRGL